MKKQLKFIAPLALAAIMATSCGGGSKHYIPGNKLKVGLICLHDNTSTYDKNFIDAFKGAIETSAKAGYTEAFNNADIKTGIEETSAANDAANAFANDGYNIVFSDSYGHDQHIKQAAIDNPYVLFSSATGDQAYASGIQNYHNAFASIYKGRYLAGYIGGLYLAKKAPSNNADEYPIGYVGALPFAEVISGYTAWYLGVQAGLEDGGKETESKQLKMYVKYSGDWYTPTEEQVCAETLIDTKGCKMISQHADSPAVPNVCKAKDVPNISYNLPGTDPKTYVAYSKINWQPYYEQVINDVFNGRVIQNEADRNWVGDKLDTDENDKANVQYNYNEELIQDAPTQKLIEDKAKALNDGDVHVFDTSTFTVKDPKEGDNYKVDADGHLTHFNVDIGDGNYIDIVDDSGYVHESEYRSAPSFNLIINGIEIL